MVIWLLVMLKGTYKAKNMCFWSFGCWGTGRDRVIVKRLGDYIKPTAVRQHFGVQKWRNGLFWRNGIFGCFWPYDEKLQKLPKNISPNAQCMDYLPTFTPKTMEFCR